MAKNMTKFHGLRLDFWIAIKLINFFVFKFETVLWLLCHYLGAKVGS